MLNGIVFENASPWWLLLCIGIGLIYAHLFYGKQIRGKLKSVLFTLRAIMVTLICLLILSPLISSKEEVEEKPLLIIAQDNSESIPLGVSNNFNPKQYQTDLKSLENQLKQQYDIAFLSFGDKVRPKEEWNFKDQQTDVSELFDYINDQYANRNIGALILASDGIINKGLSVAAQDLFKQTTIYTIGLGDTTVKKDLLIRNINYNKIAYLGNEYPLEINLSAFRSKGSKSMLTVESADGQHIIRPIQIDDDFWKQTITLKLEAKKVGTQVIHVAVKPLDQEVSTTNNRQTVYIDVLEGKEKVLILANAPHPDISALKQGISVNKNYDVDVVFPFENPKNIDQYQVVILHNLPSSLKSASGILPQLSNKSVWYIVGAGTDMNQLNQLQAQTKFTDAIPQEQYAVLNKNFYNFTISEDAQAFFNNLPPLIAPAGKMIVSGDYDVLLQQRSPAQSPLMVFKKGTRNSAFLLGEGLWRWRLENYKATSNFNAFEEFVAKTVQFLSIKEDKRKFRVYPIKPRFLANEEAFFRAELYNDNYEPLTSAEITLEIKSKSGKKFSFVFSKKESFYELNAGLLPAEEYDFYAKTNTGGKLLESTGHFVVEEIAVEYLNTTANHQFLYQLAKTSGGEFVLPNELQKLNQLISENEKITTIVHTDNTYKELINLRWIFGLLVLLLSVEWFLRKRNGLL